MTSSTTPTPVAQAVGLTIAWLILVSLFVVSIGTLIGNQPQGLYWWVWLLGAVQFGIGLFFARHCGLKLSSLGRSRGWVLALGVLVGVQALQYGFVEVAQTRLSPTWLAIEFVKFLLIIALVEELWFRGIWFQIWRGRALACIVGGAVVFGLYHLSQGWGTVATTGCIGVIYGVARWYGASLASLVGAHALMNWMNTAMLPGGALRVDASWFVPGFCLGCLIVAAGLYAFARSSGRPSLANQPE